MDKWLHWIIVGFAWVWIKIHDFVQAIGFGDSGLGWALSIVILTILVRAAIIPLYIKQIKSTRGMQALQPEMQKIRLKYKGKTDQVSRQRQSEETMELYKKAGVSPYASCLPALVQMPVLFALYRVIYAVETIHKGTYIYPNLGPLNREIAAEIYNSKFLGVSLFSTFSSASGAHKLVFVAFIVVMVGFQFFSMRLSMKRNMPPNVDPSNPMAGSQKTMMYLMPGMFMFTGFIFMMALLIYMATTAIFSWAQQLWVIKTIPTPGAPAYEELMGKREKRYQEWAKPEFERYQKLAGAAEGEELSELQTRMLASVQKNASRQKVNSDFPDDWTVADKLTVYRSLAMEPWKTLPDEAWMKELRTNKRVQDEAGNRQAKQRKRLTKEQRARRADAERAVTKKKNSKPGSNLTPEEIERRRQARRAEQRGRGSKGTGKKG